MYPNSTAPKELRKATKQVWTSSVNKEESGIFTHIVSYYRRKHIAMWRGWGGGETYKLLNKLHRTWLFSANVHVAYVGLPSL